MAQTLTAGQVDKLDKLGVHRVDHNLYVQIKPNGAKSWLCRYRINGRSRTMGLGPVRLVPLSKARTKANQAVALTYDGIDPLEVRRAEKAAARVEAKVPTFAKCATDYIAAHESGWKNEKHQYQWRASLEAYAYPTIGKLQVSEITVDHVLELLSPIWATKSETAGRVRGRIEKILDWAAAKGFREPGVNPASWRGPLGSMLPPLSKVQKIEHHSAIPYSDTPALTTALLNSDSTSASALRFLLLTAARSGEARGMRWSEVDKEAKTWTVPADRMKMSIEHRVPLSDAALAALPSGKYKPTDLVFGGLNGAQPISDTALRKALRAHYPDASVHGLRSSFSTWAREQTDYPREIVEASLAHKIGNEVERAYLRTDFIDKRRALMEAWAAYCSGGGGSNGS